MLFSLVINMTRANSHCVILTGEAGLRVAPNLADTLRQALAAHDTITVATQAITGADITTIQLLLAARKQALASGKSLSLAAPPVGALRELLVATGCIGADGRPSGGDSNFWAPQTDQGEGKAA